MQTRNAQNGETYQLGFDVTREMFDFVESVWASGLLEPKARYRATGGVGPALHHRGSTDPHGDRMECAADHS